MQNSTSLCLSGRDPIPLHTSNVCNPGFYCPNNTAAHPPQYCPPTDECLITRLQEDSSICTQPQGIFEPVVCPRGYYCPEGGKQLISCPEGHYCPLGTVEPRKCLALSVCPRESERELPLLGIFLCAVLDLILLGVWLLPWMRREWRKRTGQLGADGSMTTPASALELDPRLHDGWECTPDIEFRDVTLRYPRSDKRILHGVSGLAPSGCLMGIMGASGSGKTSLVNVLVGKVQATTGTLLLNGIETSLSKSQRPTEMIRFVPQDDIVHCHLTVRENILHSARIRLGGFLEDKAIQQHVDNIISGLGLSSVQDTVVGDHRRRGISGGERKRVSIGVELVAAPRVLILDEPTSGLDTFAALSIIKVLKSLCRHQITVICVIHQPRVEIFHELDHLLLLEAGRQAYSGKASEAQACFEHQGYYFDPKLNPGDILTDIIAGNQQPTRTISQSSSHAVDTSECTALTQSSALSDEKVPTETHVPLTSPKYGKRSAAWHQQVYLCLLRDIVQQSRQASIFVVEISASLLTGLLIGMAMYTMKGQLYYGLYHPPFRVLSSAANYEWVPRIALLVSFAVSYSAAAPSVTVFSEEELVFQRESDSGHSESAYFTGKVLTSLFRNVLSALHFTAFYMILATPFVSFGTLLGFNILYFNCVYGIGSIVAAVMKRENGPIACLLVTIVISVFGGTAPRLEIVKGWNLAWFWYLSPCTWLSEGYYTTHVTPFGYLFDEADAEAFTGYTLHRPAFDAGLLLLMGTFYRGVGCILMVLKARKGWW